MTGPVVVAEGLLAHHVAPAGEVRALWSLYCSRLGLAGEAPADLDGARLAGDGGRLAVRRADGGLALSVLIRGATPGDLPPAQAHVRLVEVSLPRGPGLAFSSDLLGRVRDELPGSGPGPGVWLPGFGVVLDELPAGPGAQRRLVAVAPGAAGLEALTWSDDDDPAPLATYLESAALLAQRAAPAAPRTPKAWALPDGGTRAALRDLDDELEKELFSLHGLRADLEDRRRELRAAANGLEAGLDGALLPADARLADRAGARVEADLDRLRIEQERAGAARAAVLSRLERGAAEDRTDVANRIFVVHGRDLELLRVFSEFLTGIGLHPLSWEELVAGAGDGPAPYIGEVVARAPLLAQASVVLMSPDDVVQLHSSLPGPRDHVHETMLAMQPRPNVIFELGQARMAYPERTLVVEVGRLRPIGDMLGVNVVRFDGGDAAVRKVAARLRVAGCTLDEAGLEDWAATNRFAGLAALERGPESHRA